MGKLLFISSVAMAVEDLITWYTKSFSVGQVCKLVEGKNKKRVISEVEVLSIFKRYIIIQNGKWPDSIQFCSLFARELDLYVRNADDKWILAHPAYSVALNIENQNKLVNESIKQIELFAN